MVHVKKINEMPDSTLNAGMVMEMAHINNKDGGNSPMNPDVYKVDVRSDEGDHRPPHIHIMHKANGWEVKVYISNGELYQVEKYGNRKRTDKFADVVKLAKEWLPMQSTLFGMTDKKNYETALIQWRVLNPDNEVKCDMVWK